MDRSYLKYKHVIIYGVSLAALFFLLKWLELRFIIISYSFEIYIGLIAVIFTALGIWLALKLVNPKIETHIETIVVEKEIITNQPVTTLFTQNKTAIEQQGLSNRELEVLKLMAQGMSNQEIANYLFVSLNTIKTHTSNLFEKLEVKRRTQAVEKAKRIQIIQ